jgi:hypothetical protein
MEDPRGAGLRRTCQADCSGTNQARPHAAFLSHARAITSERLSSSGRKASSSTQSSILAGLQPYRRAMMVVTDQWLGARVPQMFPSALPSRCCRTIAQPARVATETEFNGIGRLPIYIGIVPIRGTFRTGVRTSDARDLCHFRRWRRSNCACRGLFTLGAKSKELKPFRYPQTIRRPRRVEFGRDRRQPYRKASFMTAFEVGYCSVRPDWMTRFSRLSLAPWR